MTDEARHGALGTIETPSDAVPGLRLMGDNVRGKLKEQQRKHDK